MIRIRDALKGIDDLAFEVHISMNNQIFKFTVVEY